MEAVSIIALVLGLTLGVCSGVALSRHRDRQAWAAYVETLPDVETMFDDEPDEFTLYEGENRA